MRRFCRRRHLYWLVGIVAVGAGGVLAFSAITAGRAGSDAKKSISTLGALDLGVVAQLNQVRVAAGLTPLQTSPELAAAATEHSTEMVTDGYFAHNSHSGAVFWKRVLHYYPLVGSHSWSVGENLLWTSGTLTASQAMALWMASPAHRANVLSPLWRQIGILSLGRSAAPGTFDGRTVIVITADFGVHT
jgi:uncharacterized protein YkwD